MLTRLRIIWPLAMHSLMQAIARVNRVHGEKPGGLINRVEIDQQHVLRLDPQRLLVFTAVEERAQLLEGRLHGGYRFVFASCACSEGVRSGICSRNRFVTAL